MGGIARSARNGNGPPGIPAGRPILPPSVSTATIPYERPNPLFAATNSGIKGTL